MKKTKVWIVERRIDDGVVNGGRERGCSLNYSLAVDRWGRLRLVYRDFLGVHYISGHDPFDDRDHTPVEIVA